MPGISDSAVASTDDGHNTASEAAAPSVGEPTNIADTAAPAPIADGPNRLARGNANSDASVAGHLPTGDSPAAAVGATQPAVASSAPGVEASGEFGVAAGEVVGVGVVSSEHTDATSVGDSSATAASAPAHQAGDAVAELGTYLDGKNVLLRYNPSAAAWFRMTPRGTVREGINCLPCQRFIRKSHWRPEFI